MLQLFGLDDELSRLCHDPPLLRNASRAHRNILDRCIAATTPLLITSSTSTRGGPRGAASRRRSSASSNGAPPSNRHRPPQGGTPTWAATMSPAAMAIASTPCSPATRSVGHYVSPIPRHNLCYLLKLG